MKKRLLFAVTLSSAFLMTAGSAAAEESGFWIQQGGWPTVPDHLPISEEEYQASQEFLEEEDLPCGAWYDTYYAPGNGLEVSIINLGTGDDVYPSVYIYNYNNSYGTVGYIGNSGHIGNAMNVVSDTVLEDADNGGFTITRIDDQTVQLDFEESFLEPYASAIYPYTTSFTMTSVGALMEEAGEDRWTGAYREQTDGDYYEIISIVSLYGTGDYFVVRQMMEYQEPENGFYGQLYTERGDLLAHAQDGGVVYDGTLYWTFTKDENGTLEGTDSLSEEELSNPALFGGGGLYELISYEPIWENN